MAANLDQLPADGAQRLVIRPQKSMVIVVSAAMGTMLVVCGGPAVLMGAPVVMLILLAFVGFVLYALFSGYLWAGAERVGVSRFPWGRSCRRDELKQMEITHRGRGARVCAFVRTNGRDAFTVPENLYGKAQLRTLAQTLGVPYYDLLSGDSSNLPAGP